MATRDLTKRFVEQRAEIKAKKPRPTHRSNDSSLSSSTNGPIPGDVHLLGNSKDLEQGGPDWKAARSQLPPRWVDVVDRIDGIVRVIEAQMRELSMLHRKRLLVSFDDSAEAKKEREIQSLTDAITDRFRGAERQLTAVGKQKGDESDSEDYLSKLRAQTEGALGGGQFAFLEKKEGVGEGEIIMVPDATSETGFSQTQVAAMQNVEMIVSERDAEITRIAEGIEELAHVMKSLAGFVIDQGTVLDRIDYNMDMAVERVTQGVLQLETAEKIQKQRGPMKCIFGLVFLIFVLLILQVVKHVPRRRR
ncbi:qa-syp4 tlg2p syntaxin 16-type [Nannochloropsis oceanica]